MKRWRWVLLIVELLLFALILVLPQVELPDTAFRAGNTPIVVRQQLHSAPAAMPVVISSLGDVPGPGEVTRLKPAKFADRDAARLRFMLCVFVY